MYEFSFSHTLKTISHGMFCLNFYLHFPQIKQADLSLKMSLHIYTFAHSMVVSGQGHPLNVHLSTVQRYSTLQYNTLHMFLLRILYTIYVVYVVI